MGETLGGDVRFAFELLRNIRGAPSSILALTTIARKVPQMVERPTLNCAYRQHFAKAPMQFGESEVGGESNQNIALFRFVRASVRARGLVA